MTTSPSRTETLDQLAAPLYLVATLLVVIPVMDFVSGVLPLRPSNIEWRFATVGLLSGFLLTPILGLALAMVVAAQQEHTGFQRVLAILNLVAAVLFGALFVAFVLDVVQLRSSVRPENSGAFQRAAIIALVKYVLVISLLTWLGIRGLRVRRAARADRRPAAVMIGG